MIDRDVGGHSIELLIEWKTIRELSAALELRGFTVGPDLGLARLERKIPDLFKELRADLKENPFTRQFFAGSRNWIFNGSDIPSFTYYFEDHADLLAKLQIIENYGMIIDVTQGNMKCYRLTEELVDYLIPESIL